MAGEEKPLSPVYLFAGDDIGKIDATLSRLRARAESEGGPGALESFGSDGAPDAEALLGAIPAMSLTMTRRFLLADGVERWSAAQAKPVAAALESLPPDLTIVLVAREGSPKPKAPKALVDAVGQGRGRGAPLRRAEGSGPAGADAPGRGEARILALSRRGALLVERMGSLDAPAPDELDRLALWAGDGGEVTVEDLEAMIADTSEEVMWTLSDAIVDRDRPVAAAAAARLSGQGESVTPLVYQMAKRLREARLALAGLEAGRTPRELEASLPMHPYAAKLLLRRVKRRELDLASRLHVRGRRPRVVDARRFRLSRRMSRWHSPWREPRAEAVESGGGALRGGAGAHAGGASLLAGAGVPVKGALLHGLVDLRDERAVLGVGGLGVALGDRRLEALEVRPHRAGKMAILGPLANGAGVALAL